MADQDPLADVLTLLVTPISSTVRSVEQFRKGVDEFLRGVENFNKTMENLNQTAERINGLLEEVEQPIRAALPQVTRAVQNADEMMQAVSGPATALAPGLRQFSDMMATPAVQQLPGQLALFNEVMGEMMARMGPLAQLAESAGGMFGFRRPTSQAKPAAPAAEPAAKSEPAPTPSKKAAAKKSAAKKRTTGKKP
jgi:ABC-type transporter Mla subunit MlaD